LGVAGKSNALLWAPRDILSRVGERPTRAKVERRRRLLAGVQVSVAGGAE